MSKTASNKPSKSTKTSKSISKDKPDIEISSKFRGKFDLNKKKNNTDISLENAINLFEVIYKKHESLFKDTLIKMYTSKEVFSFVDKKGVSKVNHRIPYNQVSKFFVFHRDPTIVIMGVHHKSHKWFLVFQFRNVEDLNKFCDEIEMKKKGVEDLVVTDQSTHTPAEISDIQFEDNVDAFDLYEPAPDSEKISIHTEMQQESAANNSESYNHSDTLSSSSTKASSRCSSDSESESDNDEAHCDDLRQSKLKDLWIKPENKIYHNTIYVDENITCLNYSRKKEVPENDKSGSIYMYCAQFQNVGNMKTHSDNLTENENQFSNFKPKLIKNFSASIEFNHYDPKRLINDSPNFSDNEPNLQSSQNFNHYKPKLNKNDDNMITFEHHDPKLIK